MLKSVTVFDVSVLLNDSQEFSCLLLSPPTVEMLVEAVKLTEDAPAEIGEALSFFREINLPENDEDEAITEITIAGAILGSIRVAPLQAFSQPAKRSKKKPADPGRGAA